MRFGREIVILSTESNLLFIGWYMDEFGVESLRSKIGFVKITKVQVERTKEYIDKYVRNRVF